MSDRPPLFWHPNTWAWPHEKCRHSDCELARRTRELISRDGEYHRDYNDDIICQMVRIGDTAFTLWWKTRRMEVVLNNKLILGWNKDGQYGIADDLQQLKKTLVKLREHMVLGDLADV